MTPVVVKSGFRVTRNWPISQGKALRHPEIQPDPPVTPPPTSRATPPPGAIFTPTKSRHIIEIGSAASPTSRLRYRKISKGYQLLETEVTKLKRQNKELQTQIDALKPKKHRAIPNPNKTFI